jgi:hypothetical protein
MVSTTRFFFAALPTSVTKYSFFLGRTLMLTPLVFFKPPYDECSEIARFFQKVRKNKMKKMPEKVKKITKRSSKSPILVFRRAKTHFAFFEDLLINIFIIEESSHIYSPFRRIFQRDGENGKF